MAKLVGCSKDEIDVAAALGEKLWGRWSNIFAKDGRWYVGKFLDNDHGKPPHRRAQEVYGTGETLEEAFRFFLGPMRVYSIPGVSPGSRRFEGFTPTFDRYGRVTGFNSRAGVFTPWFPGRPLPPVELVTA